MVKRVYIIVTKTRDILKEHVIVSRSSVMAIRKALEVSGACSTVVSVQDKGVSSV